MKELIFVYNAKSDFINSAFDFAHKIISPKTYNCSLCKLTHGNFGENSIWKEFRENSDVEMTFLHKDEFEETYSKRDGYPIIYHKKEDDLIVFISTEELSRINEIESLIERIAKVSL